MLQDFFKLNTDGEFLKLNTEAEFLAHFEHSNSLKNAIYIPERLKPERPKNRMKGKAFSNVSFSKTSIEGFEFKSCSFEDCLFIGTDFKECEFHDCTFKGCNPYKATFTKTYIDPGVFTKMLDPKKHSNIGVILFQQLLFNSSEMRQPDFAKTAEYCFRKWKRYQLNHEFRKKEISKPKYLRRWIPSIAYDVIAGYGLRMRYFLFWSAILFTAVILFNHIFWSRFWMAGEHNGLDQPKLTVTIYYTVVTISTLGYGDITPRSDFGMVAASIESLLGLVWLSILASIIIKKVVR